ncbi:MAG: HAD family phosphatase [Bacteroidota bacterium]
MNDYLGMRENTIPTTIIFDLGGVLIDWNPRYLYRKIFEQASDMEDFLANICTSDWNETQDAGRSLADGTNLLLEQYPAWENEIRAFYDRWEEMLGGVVAGTLSIFRRLKAKEKYRFYALTNWSAETYPIALDRYDFLQWFEGTLVSGQEKMRKPNPLFYQRLLNRFQIDPSQSVFIDDNLRNVKAAREQGIPSIHFQSPEQLEKALVAMGIDL